MKSPTQEQKVPYTYLIGWRKLGVFYYGCRHAKESKPEDLWKTYFTSSKYVAEFVSRNGNPDVIKVTRVFSGRNQALAWEKRFLERVGARRSDRWLNKSNGYGSFSRSSLSLSEIERLRSMSKVASLKSSKNRKARCEALNNKIVQESM